MFFRLHGSYEALKYGTLLDGLADLTGGITESINIRQDPTACGRMLNKLLEMTSLITCTVQASNQQVRNQQPEKLANGIQIGVNYRLYAVDRVSMIMVLILEMSVRKEREIRKKKKSLITLSFWYSRIFQNFLLC